MVWNYAASTKAARKKELVQPFDPLGVELAIWFFILGLKHAHSFLNVENQVENMGMGREYRNGTQQGNGMRHRKGWNITY